MWQSISYYTVLGIEALVGIFGVRLYEEPRYDVIDRVAERIEIRVYPSRLAAQVELPTSGEEGRGQAFRLLFSYISGANHAAASGDGKLAMTAPVEVGETRRIAMTAPVETSAGKGVRMRFFLPASLTRDAVPEPDDPLVGVVEVPEETVAVLRFSGRWGGLPEWQSVLVAELADSRWECTSAPYALFYDAPFTLPFLRRNEAAVRVAPRDGDQ